MLTKILIRNFKSFTDVEIDLSQTVVLIGPNNSGKTTALQALALWDAGCKQWQTKRIGVGKKDASKAVTIGRKDLVYLPLSSSTALWRDMRVREGYREDDKTKTKNILIEIIVEGIDEHGVWKCGLEFEYVSEAFFYCRPLRTDNTDKPARMPVPLESIEKVTLAFLPPMSGLLMEEPLLQPGRVDVLLGSERSGEVLRNLCYQLFERNDGSWQKIVDNMRALFGVSLNKPIFVSQLGTIEIDYSQNKTGATLPLTSAGRGMQQTLLLLAYLYLNPRAVLLLDEPDAHLEILRQRQTYHLITSIARQTGAQVVCASHSEVVLNEAIERDTVIAFVGKPHVVSDQRGTQVLKALKDYGFENYIQAEQTGWVLYLEGSTDLAMLQEWANLLNHPARFDLEKPFVHYLNTNRPSVASKHFSAVKEANLRLLGIAVLDRLDQGLNDQGVQLGLEQLQWKRREIENYLCTRPVLLNFATTQHVTEDLISGMETDTRRAAMESTLDTLELASQAFQKDLWSIDAKASEDVLPPILSSYYSKVSDFRVLNKKDYFKLIAYQTAELVDHEVVEKLDAIHAVATKAKPA